MGFNLDEYVDVAERIRVFKEKYPEGTLQSEITFVEGGVLCKAFAYIDSGDERPGIGHAFEPIPGKTQFTKDSEVMNAETSAWGRAIVALGFETKKIASKEEVRNRTSEDEPSVASARHIGQARQERRDRAIEPQSINASSQKGASDDEPANDKTIDFLMKTAADNDVGFDFAVESVFGEKESPLTVGEARKVYDWIIENAAKEAAGATA